MLGKDANPLLLKTVEQMQAKIGPEMKGAFTRVVTAGETVMYSQQSRQLVIDQLQHAGDPAEVVGTAVAKLMALLMGQAKGTIQPKALIPAATVLLCDALDVAEKAGMMKVDANVLAEAMHTMSSSILQLLGVGPDKLNRLMQQRQQQGPAQPDQLAPPAPPASSAQPAAVAPAPPQGAPGGIVAQTQGAAP